MSWIKKTIALFCVGAVMSTTPVFAEEDGAPPNEAALFAALREMKGFAADFSEEKHLKLLKAPLTSTGRLYYLSPGHLVREVHTPEKMTIAVVKGIVTIRDATGTRKIDLSSRPGVAAFVESFAYFLDGDREGLKRHFQLHYSVDKGGKWSVNLTPRAAPLNQVVQAISMQGEGETVRGLTVVETNGDRSVTRLSSVNNRRQFTPQEKKQIFGL